MFSRAVTWVGLCCVACGGEARTAAAPPPKAEPVPTPVADSSEPIALVTPPPSASAEDAEPPMPLESLSGDPKPWDPTKCRGSNLEFETLQRTYECRVNERSKEAVPTTLKLAQPSTGSIPYGSYILAEVDLVNSGPDILSFTVTVGDSLPSVEFRKLQRGHASIPMSCMVSMLTSGVTLRIELEPGGKLSFSAPLYANDALSDRFSGSDEYSLYSSSSDCASKPLPRGNGYSVEARVDVNSTSLSHRWAFSVK